MNIEVLSGIWKCILRIWDLTEIESRKQKKKLDGISDLTTTWEVCTLKSG